MYKLLTKNGQLFAFGLGILLVVITLVSILTGIGDDFDGLERAKQFESTAFNFGLYVSFALIVLTVIIMVAFGLMQVFGNLKGSMVGLIGLGVIAVLFFVTKSMASPTLSEAIADKFPAVTDGISTTISGAITTTLILLAVAVAAFILSEIRNFFK